MQKHLVNLRHKQFSYWLRKAKTDPPYLYIPIFAKYSSEYLAYYVYAHECMVKQVSRRFFYRAFWAEYTCKKCTPTVALKNGSK